MLSVENLPKEVVLCPKCRGQRTVSMPPFIDGDAHYWADNVSGGYICPICDGQGYIKV